jgi:PilZ domain
MEERRKVPRLKSLLRGRVYFNNRSSTVECLVRDISSQGARLAFADDVTIPDVIELYVPHKDQYFRSHVIWRHGGETGVAFSVADQDAQLPESGNLAERVRKLELEIEQLKRMVKRIKSDMPGDYEAA